MAPWLSPHQILRASSSSEIVECSPKDSDGRGGVPVGSGTLGPVPSSATNWLCDLGRLSLLGLSVPFVKMTGGEGDWLRGFKLHPVCGPDRLQK